MEIELSFQNNTELKTYNEDYFLNIAETIFKHLNLDGYFIFEINLVTKKKFIVSIRNIVKLIVRPM